MEGAKSWLPWIKLIQIKVTMNDTHSQSLANHITLILCTQTCTILSPRLGLQHLRPKPNNERNNSKCNCYNINRHKKKQAVVARFATTITYACPAIEYVFQHQRPERANQHHNTTLELTPARIRAAQHCNHIQQRYTVTETWTKSQLNYHMENVDTREWQYSGQWGEQQGSFPSPIPQLAAKEKLGIAQARGSSLKLSQEAG